MDAEDFEVGAPRHAAVFGWPLPPMAGGSGEGEGQAEGGGEPSGDGGGGESAPDPIAQLTESFSSFQQETSRRLDELARRPAEEPQEDEGDELDELLPEMEFVQDDYDDEGAIRPEAQMRELHRMMRAVAQAEVAGVQAERAQERRDAEADALEERYPALRDESYQDEVIALTQQRARELGNPDLAREPRFLEMVHLEQVAARAAASEVPAGSTTGATLERGGGAPPAEGASADEQTADNIVKATAGRRFRLGSPA